jgi:SAM-dependent methyltransferase
MSTGSSSAPVAGAPNPAAIFETLTAYQRSFALKAAIELDIFTTVATGAQTVADIATATSSSARGTRILCDYLVIAGFLLKDGNRYSLTPTSAVFLDRKSPAFLGDASKFILTAQLLGPFEKLADIVRTGRTTLPDEGTVSADNPIWVDFARHMAPMAWPAAQEIATIGAGTGPVRVLDLAAGHGLFGIAIAQRNPQAEVTAQDWANVLAVATENAQKMGVADRHRTLPGSAFDVDFGGPYDLVLVTNFFHHFDKATCEGLIRQIYAATAPGGRCINLEFVPHEDRVSPPIPAAFAMTMLGSTESGDAYTEAEYRAMFGNAGFASTELLRLTQSPEAITISTRA